MLKVCKFGGSSVAGAEQFRKVRDIVLSDESRRVVVISAAGKRTGDDHKLTDLLYLIHAHLTYGVSCDDILKTVENRLTQIRDELDIPVLCFGLRTDFLTHTFEGSHRLFEVADSISEIKTICTCGKKAVVNARIDGNGKVVTHGGQILIGGNDSYVAMCHACWKKATKE